MVQTLKKIRYTLEQVHVSGRDNLSMLLGCINLLDETIKAQEAAGSEEEQNDDND